MTVQAATDSAAALATLQAAPAAKKDATTESADRFLKLLVTQLKNQDPLRPMDNAAVTSQMAQINTVEGINKLNATLSTMALAFSSNQALQATSMVGRQVLAEGNALLLEGGKAQGGYALDAHADGLTLTVKSASGAVVYAGELGPQEAGLHVFNWDGVATNSAQAVPGAYTFEITARSGRGTIAAQPLMAGRVDGVTPTADGVKLSVGGHGDISLASVKHIL